MGSSRSGRSSCERSTAISSCRRSSPRHGRKSHEEVESSTVQQLVTPPSVISTRFGTGPEAAAGQTAIREFFPACEQYGDSEVVFIGRAEPPITLQISREAEAEIERAQQNLIDIERDVASRKASLDPRTQWEHYLEVELRLLEARAEFDMRTAMYSNFLYDLTFFPVIVEQGLRGVTESTLMLRLAPSTGLEAGELYVISGRRSQDLIPPFPEIASRLPFIEYVDGLRVRQVGVARQELEFLAAAVRGPAIFGDLRRQSYGDLLGAPLPGVRILVSSRTETLETATQGDGSFIVSGIEPGPVVVTPLLPKDFAVANRSDLTFTLRESWCKPLAIAVELNGQIHGRILGATDTSLDGTELRLRSWHGNDFTLESTHGLRMSTRPHEDGTFDFSAVPPGSYLLTAVLQKTEDGKSRYLVTYFPGTSDLAAAVPIVVGNATQHDGIDFLVVTD